MALLASCEVLALLGRGFHRCHLTLRPENAPTHASALLLDLVFVPILLLFAVSTAKSPQGEARQCALRLLPAHL